MTIGMTAAAERKGTLVYTVAVTLGAWEPRVKPGSS